MPPLRFEKILISDERYETCGVFDVDNDGVLDIVSGAFWYPGPHFDRKYPIGKVAPQGEYYDDFSTIALDINGNGFLDFVTGGWWGNTLRWRENPLGDPKSEWKEHIVAETGNVETTRAWDLDGDGNLEIVPNTPGKPLRAYKLIRDAQGKGTGKFQEFTICNLDKKPGASGHGFGCGDIAGNGRKDLVLSKGWLEAPAHPWEESWTFHEEFDLGCASCPIVVTDVNGDGLADLIVGQAHGYGLDWWEQRRENGKRKWIKHPIDPFNSQYHDLQWVDIDNDGQFELITGKRYRAHCENDPGEYDPYGSYYFKWTGENFVKQVIDFGPIRQAKGLGIHFQIADLNGNGWKDIVAPGKDGLFIFRNLGYAQNMVRKN